MVRVRHRSSPRPRNRRRTGKRLPRPRPCPTPCRWLRGPGQSLELPSRSAVAAQSPRAGRATPRASIVSGTRRLSWLLIRLRVRGRILRLLEDDDVLPRQEVVDRLEAEAFRFDLLADLRHGHLVLGLDRDLGILGAELD